MVVDSLSLSNRGPFTKCLPFAEESLKFEFTKSVLCFCMLVVNPLAVEITFSLIELQKVGVQQSLKVVNHIMFSFFNSLESFVEAGVLFP